MSCASRLSVINVFPVMNKNKPSLKGYFCKPFKKVKQVEKWLWKKQLSIKSAFIKENNLCQSSVSTTADAKSTCFRNHYIWRQHKQITIKLKLLNQLFAIHSTSLWSLKEHSRVYYFRLLTNFGRLFAWYILS